MSTRIQQTFDRLRASNEGALVNFITAGDPSIKHTADLIVTLADAGADVIELGIPYSDPLADGPSIQASSQRALDRGVTPPMVLDMVRQARERTDVPLVLMTSYNLVLRSGLTKFAHDAHMAGADGTILTDLPPEEAAHWKSASENEGLSTIFLVAPTSTPIRIQTIADNTTGFVYCVSRTGVTGARTEMAAELAQFLQSIRAKTDKPLCVGFGVSTPQHVHEVIGMADGAVIGSALVDFLFHNADNPDQDTAIRALVGSWKAATRRG
jgi:tryptophan synthase alpha chain